MDTAVGYPGQPREKNGRFAEGEMAGIGDAYEKPKGFTTNARGEKTLDKKERKRYNEMLVGEMTSDGTEITRLSKHAYDRAAQRNISPGEIADALKQKVNPSKNDLDCSYYQNTSTRIVVNHKTGVIVTIMWREKQ